MAVEAETQVKSSAQVLVAEPPTHRLHYPSQELQFSGIFAAPNIRSSPTTDQLRSASSIRDENSSIGGAPRTNVPLMKNPGVPVSPYLFPSAIDS